MPLAYYWEDNYIGRQRSNRRGNLRFAIDAWNVHNRVGDNLPRTNNSEEVWHRAFQQTEDCNHPSVFKLINHFRVEQANVEIEMEGHLSGVHQPEASKNVHCSAELKVASDSSNVC